MKTAGILTIGNEILQGYTLDLNANTISKELTKRNINVTIHLTVPDSVSKFQKKLKNLYKKIMITYLLQEGLVQLMMMSQKRLF